MENEFSYSKIEELLENIPDNYTILEEQIDINVQMEYFEQARLVKDDLDEDSVMESVDNLYDEAMSSDDKKKLLSQLASIDDVKAYRLLEKYAQVADESTKDWAILAVKESKLLLESKLLEESQVFISTGLGGKGMLLRFCMVFMAKENKELSDVQQKILKSELEFALRGSEGEIERIDFDKELTRLMILLPIKAPIRTMFKQALAESNQYGDFMKNNFFVTNVREMSFEEVRRHVLKMKVKDSKEE